MKENYYITQDGVLKRKQNTVYFVNKEVKRILPVEKIHSIYALGSLSFTSGVVSYLAKKGVSIHFFNYYGFYEASLYPREGLVSGDVLIKQVNHHMDSGKRLFLAKEFIQGCGENCLRNLSYYNRNKGDLSQQIDKIKRRLDGLENAGGIKEVLSCEGGVWNNYYKAFDEILPDEYRFEKRSRRPPENMVNCLISFGNSLLYSTVLSEIYHTQLNPSVSFLHEPSDRRFSLSLDLSEVFRPLLVDRVFFKLLNKGMLDESGFRMDVNCCLLNDKGRKIFLREWDKRLHTTIKHRKLGRKVSYRRLIRLECYKLVKHLMGEKEYKAFRMWW